MDAASRPDDLSGYSPRRVRFLLLHREAFATAYLNPSGGGSSHELARLEREYQTLPPRHSGWCPSECPSELWAMKNRRHPIPCVECRRLRGNVQYQDIALEFGRGAPPGSRVPRPEMLDLARAIDVIGSAQDSVALARYMSLNGQSLVQPDADSGQDTGVVADVFTSPSPALVTVPCHCLGYRLGGPSYCQHQRAA